MREGRCSTELVARARSWSRQRRADDERAEVRAGYVLLHFQWNRRHGGAVMASAPASSPTVEEALRSRRGTIRAAGRCPGTPGTRHRTRRPARWPGRRSSASGDMPTGRRGPAETPDRAPSGSAQLVRRGHAYGGPAPLSRMRTSRRALRLSQSGVRGAGARAA